MNTVEIIEQNHTLSINDGSIVAVPGDAVDVVEVGGGAPPFTGIWPQANGGTGRDNLVDALNDIFDSLFTTPISDPPQMFFVVREIGNPPALVSFEDFYYSYVASLQSFQITAVETASNYIGQFTDGSVEIDCTGGNRTYTLPPLIGSIGRTIIVKKKGGANTLTISGNANIDGAASLPLTVNRSAVILRGHPSEWKIVSRYL